MERQNFIDNMAELMRQMGELCGQSDDVTICDECPFDRYCNVLVDAGYDLPSSEWSNV